VWRSEIPAAVYARLYAGWRKVRREAEIIDPILRKRGARRIIEFGCGLGRHGYLLRRMGYEVVLSDIEDRRIGPARKRDSVGQVGPYRVIYKPSEVGADSAFIAVTKRP